MHPHDHPFPVLSPAGASGALDLVADLQDTLPDPVARNMTYDLGLALGVAAGSARHPPLAAFLIDAVILSRRHGVAPAAERMGVSEPGLRGFLDGAREHPILQTPAGELDAV